jgi:hypothetical protein
MKDNYKLCYIEKNFAYFTTKDLKDQWGDDWDDVPYEYNAGRPYCPRSEEDKKNPWKIIMVAFDCDNLITPDDNYANSPFSVKQINAGQIAWLRSPSWVSVEEPIAITAGSSIENFEKLVLKAGGEVFFSKSYLKENNE